MFVPVLLLLVTISATSIATTSAKTVVFLPPPIPSYFLYHNNVAGALASLGHEVWICVPHFLLPQKLVKDKSVQILVYGEKLGDITAQVYQKLGTFERFWRGEQLDRLSTFFLIKKVFKDISRKILATTDLVENVKKLKPDLFVLDSIFFNMNMIVLPYKLGVPYALIGTIHDIVLCKVPFSPAAPLLSAGKITDRPAFFDRVMQFVFYVLRINFDLLYDSGFISEFASEKPYLTINELASRAEIFIVEIDHIMDYPRPVLPNTKLIGGSSATPVKPLEGEFKKFVEESNTDIIVVTFGGGIVNLPPHISSKMAAAFLQLDLNVVWRVNISSPDPKKILTSMWVPQNDLLGQKKVKLFVSHCGKNGQYEALYHGVPILCLPFYGDQGYNAERIEIKGLGLQADIRTVTTEELVVKVKEILHKGNYSENIRKASLLYRELYKIPKQEAAYWLDHVIQYGGAYMRSSGQEMPYYQLYVMDVLAFLVGILVVVLIIVFFLVKSCIRMFRGSRKTVKPKID